MAGMMSKDSKWASNGKGIRASLTLVVAVLIIAAFFIAVFNYSFPDFFEAEHDENIVGLATLNTLAAIGEDLSGNWLPNDVIWPTILLDNPQNYQLGELEVLRYSVRVLRDNLSRLRTTDRIDLDADLAHTNFSNDPLRWMWPSTESKLKAGTQHLQAYADKLKSGKAQFYPRGDNLIELLNQQNSLLGGVCTRLAAIPNDFSDILTEETAGDTTMEGEKVVRLHVPWMEIDNYFYYAQGVAFALRQLMMAVRVDFAEILKLKKASELMDNIIILLNNTQWEPKYMVMNCSPGSWLPCQNDPMMLNSRLQDTRQKIRSVISMIQD